ncbi:MULTISPECIES: hypothetical protein [Paraburkholderia]|uniref:hypothetical protein n=1 Tax=Paraburkholderia TaxID=1822464 RepID=UPI00047F799F|nr:hypothetical protein [Paraburkholderia mimosarum]
MTDRTTSTEDRLRAFVDDLRACQHDIDFTRAVESSVPTDALLKRVNDISDRAHEIWLEEINTRMPASSNRDEALEPIMLLKGEIQNLVVACRRALGKEL